METQIRRLSRKGIAEFLGTFLLVLIGTGAIVFNDLIYPIGGFGISLSFFIAVFGSVFIFGKYSGAHINPAVSAMFYLKKDISRNEFIVYVIAQCLGAILASFALKLIAPTHPDLGTTFAKVGATNTFIIEFSMTYFLCIGILLFCDSPKSKFTGLVAATIVFFEAYFGGPFTGASMNPARSLGPALVSGNLVELWVYFVAPVLGAILAYKSCKFIVPSNSCCVEGGC